MGAAGGGGGQTITKKHMIVCFTDKQVTFRQELENV